MISYEYEEEDLDDLDLKEFKSEDSDEDDVYEVADHLGILGNVQEDQMQAKLEKTSEPEKNTDEDDKTNLDNEQETAKEKLQLGSLYIALQQMRRATKLNLSAINRILNIVKENPSMAFLKKIIKPMCEMVPEDPLNAVVNMIHVPKNAVPSIMKYNVAEVQVKKVIPIKILENGKFKHKCPLCDKVMVPWGRGIDTHIKVEHFNQAYSCPHCTKECKSLDGMCHHIRNCKTDKS